MARLAASTALAAPLIFAAPGDVAGDGTDAASTLAPDYGGAVATMSAVDPATIAPALDSRFIVASETPGAATAGTAATASASASTAAFGVGPVSFAAPWVLAGLVSLPLLWLLMKSIPPQPRREPFPAIRLLFNLKSAEQQPDQMPLWQRLLRLSAAAAVIVGMAQPQLDRDPALTGNGPLVLVVDNGWASALRWDQRAERMAELIDRAENEGREVILLSTAPQPGEAGDEDLIAIHGPLPPSQARQVAEDLRAHPWPVDREATALQWAQQAEEYDLGQDASIVWLSNGLAGSGPDDGSAALLAAQLSDSGSLTVIQDRPQDLPHLLAPAAGPGGQVAVTVRRPDAGPEQSLSLAAFSEDGQVIARTEAVMEEDAQEVQAVFDIAPAQRAAVTRVMLEGENTAGAVVLRDEQWRLRTVGILMPESARISQPLIDETLFVESALSPYYPVSRVTASDLLDPDYDFSALSALIVTDMTAAGLVPSHPAYNAMLESGGALVRFAGPALAAQQQSGTPDTSLPVPLHRASSAGGALDVSIAPFEEGSPFYGLTVPPDLRINQMILPQPGPHLDERSWARLDNGTPLVTAHHRPDGGLSVLFHSTANAEWGDLALSGLYVDMLQATVEQSRGVSASHAVTAETGALMPLATMDETGQLQAPPSYVQPLGADDIGSGATGPAHPPGYYGDGNNMRHAHNLAAGVATHKAMDHDAVPDSARLLHYDDFRGKADLKGPFLTAAMGLFFFDMVALMAQQGFLGRRRQSAPKKPQQGRHP